MERSKLGDQWQQLFLGDEVDLVDDQKDRAIDFAKQGKSGGIFVTLTGRLRLYRARRIDHQDHDVPVLRAS